jgi:hypothetical protein
MDQELSNPNYLSTGQYLPSFSLDPANPFSSPEQKSYNYSSYFIPVRKAQYHTTSFVLLTVFLSSRLMLVAREALAQQRN